MANVDRLSALPDSILACNIFSRLSLRDVVRTSLLSTRWRSLWKQTPHLDFSGEFFRSMKPSHTWRRSKEKFWKQVEREMEYMSDVVDNILLLHSGHMERFSLHATFCEDILYVLGKEQKFCEILRVEQWIHHAALKQVKHLSLKFSDDVEPMDMPPSLFACHLLRDLELYNLNFCGIPAGFDGFRYLQSCSLLDLPELRDDVLQQFIGLCPLLHKLVINFCFQLCNLNIQAPNLNSLSIVNCYSMESLIVDCPQMVELAIEKCKNLIDFKMNSCVLFHDMHMIPKEHPRLNSLRKLSVKACPKVSDLTLLTTIGCFYNLEEVHIQIFEERAKGEVVADPTFPSLKKVYVYISSAMMKEEEIMVACLLNNAPSLKSITLILPHCLANIHNKEFIKNKVMDLQQIYENVDIRMEIEEKVNIRMEIEEDRHAVIVRDTDHEYGELKLMERGLIQLARNLMIMFLGVIMCYLI